MPGILGQQDAPQVVLEGSCYARQAEWHANVAVRWTLTPSSTRRPEALLRCGPVEPWDVDADTHSSILAWMGSCALCAAVATHDSCVLQFLSGLGDELLSGGHSLPCVLLRETCREARLQVVPKRPPREVGKV